MCGLPRIGSKTSLLHLEPRSVACDDISSGVAVVCCTAANSLHDVSAVPMSTEHPQTRAPLWSPAYRLTLLRVALRGAWK